MGHIFKRYKLSVEQAEENLDSMKFEKFVT